MNKIELERIDNFRDKHYKKCKCGKFKITIIPNGIGDSITIKCTICKKKKDIADIDSW